MNCKEAFFFLLDISNSISGNKRCSVSKKQQAQRGLKQRHKCSHNPQKEADSTAIRRLVSCYIGSRKISLCLPLFADDCIIGGELVFFFSFFYVNLRSSLILILVF